MLVRSVQMTAMDNRIGSVNGPLVPLIASPLATAIGLVPRTAEENGVVFHFPPGVQD